LCCWGLLGLILAACGAQPRAWGNIVVGPGGPVLLGIAATTAPSPQAPRGLSDIAYGPSAPAQGEMIAGHPLQFVPVGFDCQTEQPSAIVVDRSALRDIAGLIGPPCSSACVYVQSTLYELRTTMIAPACTAAAVVQQGYPIAFRLAWNDDDQAALAAGFSSEDLKATRVAVVRDTTVFGRSLANRFVGEFQGRGRSVVQIELPPAGDFDRQRLAQSVQDANPSAVVLFVDRQDASDVFSDLSTRFPRLPLIGADTALVGSTCALVPGARPPNATICPLTTVAAPRLVTVGLAEHDKTWASELDDDPLEGAALAEDALAVYTAAIRRVAKGQPDGSLLIPRQALRDAIAHTQTTGHSGRIEFDSSGERRHDVGAAMYRIDVTGLGLVDELRR
jgi:branched-chain amino acid transport system substrate-binding protein